MYIHAPIKIVIEIFNKIYCLNCTYAHIIFYLYINCCLACDFSATAIQQFFLNRVQYSDTKRSVDQMRFKWNRTKQNTNKNNKKQTKKKKWNRKMGKEMILMGQQLVDNCTNMPFEQTIFIYGHRFSSQIDLGIRFKHFISHWKWAFRSDSIVRNHWRKFRIWNHLVFHTFRWI